MGCPIKLRRVANYADCRVIATVEDDIEPVIFLEALGRSVLVAGQSNLANLGSALYLDEPNLNRSLGLRDAGVVKSDRIRDCRFPRSLLRIPRARSYAITASTAMCSISSSRTMAASPVLHDPDEGAPKQRRAVGCH